MMSIKSPGRSLRLEQLESKQLLTANTMVQIVDETLQIFGDDQPNFVEITSTDAGIEVSTRGSFLNGSINATFTTLRSEFRNIDIRLRGDTDSINFHDISLDESISIQGGSGTDVFRFSNFSNANTRTIPHVSILGGVGDDNFIAQSSWFNTLDVKLGKGGNLVSMKNSTVFRTSNFEMMGGHDSIFLESNQFKRFSEISTGNGGEFTRIERNRFDGSFNYTAQENTNVTAASFRFHQNEVSRDMKARLGDGANQIIFSSSNVGGNLYLAADTVQLSAGAADDVRVSNSSIGGYLVINSGSGDDFVSVARSDIGADLKLRSGTGNDEVKARRLDVVGAAEIQLDDGNDELLIDHTSIGGRLKINGSHGHDTLFGIGSEVGGEVIIRSGAGEDEIFTIFMDIAGETSLFGSDDDDYVMSFASTFAADVLLEGGKGVNHFSNGLDDPNRESNFFFGNVIEKEFVDGIPVDFRAILADLRQPN